MRVLFLSRWFPEPADNGSKIRIFNALTSLAERHEVSLVSFGRQAELDATDRRARLAELCHTVRVLPYRDFRPSSATSIAGLLSPAPRFLVDTFQPAMRRAVLDEVDNWRPDAIVASQLDMVPYALGVPGVPRVLDELELTVFDDRRRIARSTAARWRATLTWLKLVAYLRRALPRFGACTVASELERYKVRRAVPRYSRVHVLPNTVDLTRYRGGYGPPQPNSIVYSGALTYSANYDAVEYFVRDVLPRIAQAEPGVRVRVTGDLTGVDIDDTLRTAQVTYTGYVQDVRPVVAQSWISVVPLRQGGGTRLKILEAMALGTPVVSTSKGAEGLNVRDGEHLLLADDPETFASRALQVLRSPRLRAQLATAGRALVESKYDSRRVGGRLCELVEQAASAGCNR